MTSPIDTEYSDKERRKFTRIQFDTTTTITQNNNIFDAHLIDISLNGLLVETPKQYTLRSDLSADITMTLSNDTTIAITAKLIHSSDNTLGFQCESIDIESMGHLRRLLELNMSNPHATERLLAELLQPH